MSDSSPRGLTEEQQRVKERFLAVHGHWDSVHDELLRTDPEYFEKYVEFSAVPFEGGAIDEKTTHLIAIAVDSAVTHLYEDGIRHHVSAALDCGASVEEILEVFELASVLGVHSVTYGGPLLMEQLGLPEESDGSPEERDELEVAWREKRGYWKENWGNLASYDHDFIERYLAFSSHPWESDVLPPKTREFVYIAIDISTTHLYEPGTITHMKNAINYGATEEEIMEVFEIAAVIGFQTVREGLPILVEEARKRGLV